MASETRKTTVAYSAFAYVEGSVIEKEELIPYVNDLEEVIKAIARWITTHPGRKMSDARIVRKVVEVREYNPDNYKTAFSLASDLVRQI